MLPNHLFVSLGNDGHLGRERTVRGCEMCKPRHHGGGMQAEKTSQHQGRIPATLLRSDRPRFMLLWLLDLLFVTIFV